jgi:hypothetical protein
MKRSMCAVAVLSACAGAASAQVWAEIPDATAFPPGQVTVGAGPLIDITGFLAGASDVDMYCIDILTPSFSAWTEAAYPPGTLGPAGAAFDSQLWLFDATGAAIMHSDDTTLSALSGMGLAQPNPIFGPAPPPILPGRYMLAISQYDNDALDPGGLEIWADVPFPGYSGPDGPGAPFFGGWSSGGAPGGPGGGAYHIVLAGATFCIPTPGALALLGVSGVVACRRRR